MTGDSCLETNFAWPWYVCLHWNTSVQIAPTCFTLWKRDFKSVFIRIHDIFILVNLNADWLHYSQQRAHSYFSRSAREDPLPLAKYVAAAADAALRAREISAKGGGLHDGFSSDGSFGDILEDGTSVQSENFSVRNTWNFFLCQQKMDSESRGETRAQVFQTLLPSLIRTGLWSR